MYLPKVTYPLGSVTSVVCGFKSRLAHHGECSYSI